jgi:uncharacterized protein DUF1236
MHKAPLVVLALMLSFIGTNAYAQTPPPASPPSQVPATPPATPKLNLTLEQRYTIREIIKDKKEDGALANVHATVGEPIPQGVTPQAMPSDVAAKVPQVKAHRYFRTAQEIVIVDPKDNKVAEVIKLAGE